MRPFLTDNFANPSSPYTFGRAAASVIAGAREHVAKLINAQPTEIIFTSGGTESNNTALQCSAHARAGRRHIVTSQVEHASVLNFCKNLSGQGQRVTFLGVDAQGRLDLNELRRAVDEQTALVSIMMANNETGAIFPVAEMAGIAHERGALFHTDAVQAAGKIPCDSKKMDADFISLGAHKLHGPKGIGALYIREGLEFVPYHIGGDQEYARRAGTENVPGIAGFGAAAELSADHLDDVQMRVRALRDEFEKTISARLADVRIAGHEAERLPNTSNVLIRGVESEALLARLDLDGLCCSSGSACAAGAHEPSHVLRAMGLPAGKGWGALRVSLSRFNTADEMEYLADRLVHSIQVLRGV
jgi:cysteine desulfurase